MHSPIIFDTFPEIVTERLILNEITMKDLDVFHALRSNKEIMKYIPGRLAKTKQDTIDIITNSHNLLAEGNNISWGIRIKVNNLLIGSIGYYRIQWSNLRGEIGYILHPEFQGKGIMSEAMKTILDFGFETMKFHTIEAVLDPENKASENILIRNGFVKEAHYKENFFSEGKYYDSLVYTKFK
jgi:ribosomal-protein-alanine N-acetyltransferase